LNVLWDLFVYVIVNLIIICHIIAKVLLDYTGLRFEIFCQDYPSFNSRVSQLRGGQPSPRFEAAMKLTCLSISGGGGGSYHSPASHLLEMEGLRFLLDCPIDLSALAAFAPVPLTGGEAGLIRAVPRYWSPTAAAAAKAGGVDAVLVSSATGMLGLPFLTRLPGFANTKKYKGHALWPGHHYSLHCKLISFIGLCNRGSSKDWKANDGGAGGDAPRVCKVLWARYRWVTQVDGRGETQ
jgi:hypothetical protein